MPKATEGQRRPLITKKDQKVILRILEAAADSRGGHYLDDLLGMYEEGQGAYLRSLVARFKQAKITVK